MNDADLEVWCDETLPELYDVAMLDCEEISEDVWESVATAMEPLLDVFDDEEERDAFATQLTEVAAEWFRVHHALQLELIESVPAAVVAALRSKPQTTQHSADWYSQRRNRLTASEFAQILDGRRGALLRQKLSTEAGDRVGAAPVGIAQEDGEMNATTWGHRFEPVTRRIYELEIAGVDTVCDTLGRFTHPTIPWLSASPDGLIVKGPLTGRLIEIKSPKTRQPDTFVPFEYYVQMQLQMEVCDLDVVEFVEAQFKQRPHDTMTIGDLQACTKAAWKGEIEVRGYPEDPTSWRYRYTEPVEDLHEAVFTSDPILEALPLLEYSVWWLTGWFPRTVLRNREWWSSVGWPNAQLFWAEVCSLKEQTPDHDEVEQSSWLGSSV